MENKWQPVVLILDRRLECACGALGIFVVAKHPPAADIYAVLDSVDVWCQQCFQKAQEEEMRDAT